VNEPWVLADASTGAVYTQQNDRGPVHYLAPDGTCTERYRTPVGLFEPLMDAHGAAAWAIEQLRGAALSQKARAAIAEALQVDW